MTIEVQNNQVVETKTIITELAEFIESKRRQLEITSMQISSLQARQEGLLNDLESLLTQPE